MRSRRQFRRTMGKSTSLPILAFAMVLKVLTKNCLVGRVRNSCHIVTFYNQSSTKINFLLLTILLFCSLKSKLKLILIWMYKKGSAPKSAPKSKFSSLLKARLRPGSKITTFYVELWIDEKNQDHYSRETKGGFNYF